MLKWLISRRRVECVAQAIALAVLSLALSACGTRSETFRYRMTVEVDTPHGPRIGSSVIEVRISEKGDNALVFPEASGINLRVRGEAVAVDLPDGKVLFALLRAPGYVGDAAGLPFAALEPPRPEGNYDFVRQTRAMKRMDQTAALPRMLPRQGHLPERSAYPMLVTFTDIDDPTSVQLVDPDNLAAPFGEGYALKRITVQITDEPVTTGIEEWLPEQFFKKWASQNEVIRDEIGLKAHFRTLSGQLSRNDFVAE